MDEPRPAAHGNVHGPEQIPEMVKWTCLVKISNHNSHMRVKIGELKAKLSSYLKLVRESGESIEVCAREDPVAYLVPLGREGDSEAARGVEELRERLAVRGLVLGGGPVAEKPRRPDPSLAGDGREDVMSVERMRESRDW